MTIKAYILFLFRIVYPINVNDVLVKEMETKSLSVILN